MLRTVGSLVLCGLLLAAAGCSEGSKASSASSAASLAASPAPAAAQAGAVVTVQLFQFQPSPLTVPAGTVVTWTNQDDTEHTVTSGTPGARDGRFDSPLRGKGATFTFTAQQPGTYAYFCSRHDSMRGEIRVQ